MPIYDKGDQVRITATFTSDSVNTDPTDNADDVLVTWRRPSGRDTNGVADQDATPTPTKTATGIYFVDLTLDEEGVHTIRVKGLEGVVAADIVELQVANSVFPD
jgi:hypothetical protein|tara:strand:- start:20075 stop:20386 length:312 start_codon:yes stop_codon:yes gene_type:complete